MTSCSSVGLEHRSYAPGVTGSSPVSTKTFFLVSFLFFFSFFRSFVAALSMRPLGASRPIGPLGPIGSSRLLSGPSFHVGSSSPPAPITSALYYYYYYAKCAIWRGPGPSLPFPRHDSVLFQPLGQFVLFGISLPSSGAFLRICARRHRGPPQKRRSIVALSRL